MGNATYARGAILLYPVHPHVHGERDEDECLAVEAAGSSPRTWGTPVLSAGRSNRDRFIPTYMGNARPSPLHNGTLAVHPHVHGERPRGGKEDSIHTGSSPRTWGTPLFHCSRSVRYRFIPTYMGNAGLIETDFLTVEVHPHVHGERDAAIAQAMAAAGSSPRTWGTRRQSMKRN